MRRLTHPTQNRNASRLSPFAWFAYFAVSTPRFRTTLLVLGFGCCLAPLLQAGVPAPVSDAKQAALQVAVAKVYDLSILHRIDIVIAAEDATQVGTRSTNRVRCKFTFDGITLKEVGVRQAGGTFWPYRSIANKPSLSLKFNEFVKGQNLHGLQRMVLKNEFQDLSLLNEHLTYEVFRRADLAAPMSAYAVVTINGILNGIYLMREPINEEFLVRNFGSGNETGNLYEFELPNREFMNVPGAPLLKDEFKEHRERSDLIALAAATSAAPPEYFIQAVSPLIDLDRYVRFLAVEAITSDMDGFSFHNNNSLLYDLPQDGRFILIPYGADEAFWATATPITRLNNTPAYDTAWGLFRKKVQSVPELAQRLNEEVARASNPPIWDTPALLGRVEQISRILNTAEKTGRTVWDLALFEANRPVIEAFIRAGGTTGMRKYVAALAAANPPAVTAPTSASASVAAMAAQSDLPVAAPARPPSAPVVSPSPTNSAVPAARPAPSSSRSAEESPVTSSAPAVVAQAAVTRTRAQLLEELLLQYRSDQIGPAEYQQERAKILARP